MYSDRIHHALAFAAKHFPERVSRYDGQSCLLRASSVAVILARYGADESTIAASILKHLVDACPYHRQASLESDIFSKFGPTVGCAVDAAAEPRFDVLGRERTWKACRSELLIKIAGATPMAVDVCVAEELHRAGAALVAIRRLGIEYIDTGGVPTPEETVWWLRSLVQTLREHPTWTRADMLHDFHRLASELISRFADDAA